MIPTLGDDPEFMVWFIQTSMIVIKTVVLDFPGGVLDRNLFANAGDMGVIPGLRRLHTWGATTPTCHRY